MIQYTLVCKCIKHTHHVYAWSGKYRVTTVTNQQLFIVNVNNQSVNVDNIYVMLNNKIRLQRIGVTPRVSI